MSLEQKRPTSFAARLHVFLDYKTQDLPIYFCYRKRITVAIRKNKNKNSKHETNIDGYFFI